MKDKLQTKYRKLVTELLNPSAYPRETNLNKLSITPEKGYIVMYLQITRKLKAKNALEGLSVIICLFNSYVNCTPKKKKIHM